MKTPASIPPPSVSADAFATVVWSDTLYPSSQSPPPRAYSKLDLETLFTGAGSGGPSGVT